jgi:hypothetical protein
MVTLWGGDGDGHRPGRPRYLGDEDRAKHRTDTGNGLDGPVAGVAGQFAGDPLGHRVDLERVRVDQAQKRQDPGLERGGQAQFVNCLAAGGAEDVRHGQQHALLGQHGVDLGLEPGTQRDQLGPVTSLVVVDVIRDLKRHKLRGRLSRGAEAPLLHRIRLSAMSGFESVAAAFRERLDAAGLSRFANPLLRLARPSTRAWTYTSGISRTSSMSFTPSHAPSCRTVLRGCSDVRDPGRIRRTDPGFRSCRGNPVDAPHWLALAWTRPYLAGLRWTNGCLGAQERRPAS